MCDQNRIDGCGRLEETVDVVVCRIAFRDGLQARVEEKSGEKFERSAADECESAIVTFASVKVGLMCDGSKRKLSIGAEQIRR